MVDNNDKLNVTNYIEGLTDFIENTDTPITISIEGEWGSGKSFIVDKVKDKLIKDGNKFIEFNSWLFSQFNNKLPLPIMLIDNIIKQLTNEKENTITGAYNIISSMVYLATSGKVELDEVKDKFNKEPSQLYIKLKQKLNEIIDNNVSEDKRCVIFIDDLDRIAPDKAIEIMEIVYNFIRINKCITILAIDKEVVETGLTKKYGNSINEEKAKKFFEKIIQVHFDVPTNIYKIDEFIKSRLSKQDKEILDKAIKFIKTFVSNNNPRSIERLLYEYELYKCFSKAKKIGTEYKECILLSLCLLNANYDLWKDIVAIIKNDSSNPSNIINEIRNLNEEIKDEEENGDSIYLDYLIDYFNEKSENINHFIEAIFNTEQLKNNFNKDKYNSFKEDEAAIKLFDNIKERLSNDAKADVKITSYDGHRAYPVMNRKNKPKVCQIFPSLAKKPNGNIDVLIYIGNRTNDIKEILDRELNNKIDKIKSELSSYGSLEIVSSRTHVGIRLLDSNYRDYDSHNLLIEFCIEAIKKLDSELIMSNKDKINNLLNN